MILVKLLQVVKRTNTPLNSLTRAAARLRYSCTLESVALTVFGRPNTAKRKRKRAFNPLAPRVPQQQKHDDIY